MKLKPCPFCKGSSVILREDRGLFFVACYCGARGPSHFTKRIAIEAWNTRHTDITEE